MRVKGSSGSLGPKETFMSTESLLASDEVAYRTCSCEHCPEIALGVAGTLCGDCEDAGCTPTECQREDEIFAEFFPEGTS